LGLTNGGPIYLPHLYDGHGKAFYFFEYQSFRQVLGTTQVFSVPTAQQRAGIGRYRLRRRPIDCCR